MSAKEKLNIKQTFLIGLGFFAVSISWSVYNSFVPPMLEKFITQTFWIGVIMSIDNVFGVIFQPLFGRLSDKCNSRFGRRMPFIIIGAPLAALFFTLIPFNNSLPTLMLWAILFNFIMSAWRSPVVALMPDLTPPKLRSQGNGIINLWGGVGSVFAFFIGGILHDKIGQAAPFAFSAVVMVIAAVLLFLTIKERKILDEMGLAHHIAQQQEAEKAGEAAKAAKAQQPQRKLSRGERTSLILILCAIFLWFCGFNVVETFFTLFATKTYGVTQGTASSLLTFYSLAFLVMSVPAGYIAAKIGRRRAILTGLCVDILIFLTLFIISTRTENLMLLRVLLIVGGLFWAFVNINSLPMVVELAGRDMVGTYTGYYYAFSQTAAIVSPILFGLIRDLTQKFSSVLPYNVSTENYHIMFLYSSIAFIGAAVCILFVKHGEAKAD